MKFCPRCGQGLTSTVTTEEPGRGAQEGGAYLDGAPENTSGHGSAAIVPEATKGWNWGAFWFGWLWGVCNNTWIALLSLIPYAGFVMSIVLGIKGNEWAWRNKKWDSVEHFKRTQGNWAIAALVMFLIVVTLLIIVFVAP